MNLILTRHRILLSATALSITSIAALALLTPRSASPILKASMSTTSTFPVRAYTPRHATWPYSKADMTPQDPSSDADFYSSPRFVTHIDDNAIETLAKYYDTALPRTGRILDFCSSWISHFPRSLDEAAKEGEVEIAGMGMSAPEMRSNKLLQGRWAVKDLNKEPVLPSMSELFEGKLAVDREPAAGKEEEVLDASVCVVSIDYLTSPVEILQSVRKNTKVGGTVHLIISNRCFPTKAVGRWLRIGEEERLGMVGDYLHFAGWKDIEILTLSDGKLEDDGSPAGGGLAAMMKMLTGGGGCDPLWVVRARKA
jgi:hypothetical protein